MTAEYPPTHFCWKKGKYEEKYTTYSYSSYKPEKGSRVWGSRDLQFPSYILFILRAPLESYLLGLRQLRTALRFHRELFNSWIQVNLISCPVAYILSIRSQELFSRPAFLSHLHIERTEFSKTGETPRLACIEKVISILILRKITCVIYDTCDLYISATTATSFCLCLNPFYCSPAYSPLLLPSLFFLLSALIEVH